MRRLKLLLASAGFLLAVVAPLLTVGAAQAATVCTEDKTCDLVQLGCNSDLAVDKQVKVPGGSFVEAPTSASAPSAHVGDTVEWLITVSNHSTGCEGTPEFPGTIILHETLPVEVTYVTSQASAGTYDSSTNDWSFNNLAFSSQSTISLLITTKANQVGTFENVTALSNLHVVCQAEVCEIQTGTYDYQDGNADDNSAVAWVNVQSDPQVLAASTTAPDTGFGQPRSNAVNPLAAVLILSGTVGLLVVVRRYSRR